MKFNLCVFGALLAAAARFLPLASAQEPDGSDVEKQATERNARVDKLTLEEQLKLRAAQQKAAEDPAVKAALEKRNQAIAEFRMALRNSVIKADPKMEAVLDKIAVGNGPGF